MASPPASRAQLRAILRSPSYVEADQDPQFLNRPEVRGLRLQLDYTKAEVLLEDHQIRSTIVVLGSTRVIEPDAAWKQVAALRSALAMRPRDTTLAGQLAAAERIAAKSHYYDMAREFARLASLGSDEFPEFRPVIVTGGGPGLMEAANRGSADVGAKTAGFNIALPHEQRPNAYVTPELCFSFHYFAVRKMHLLLRAVALVAFPGGYGTLDELFETLALVQSRKMGRIPIVLVGERFWRAAVNFDFLRAEGVIDAADLELFSFVESASDIWRTITRHYRVTSIPGTR